MKKLKSITLSNIRRFGANTKIELSPGATILLAPNGTGKTAFFEAIEFGVTGGISRLGQNLTPIIRDTQNSARVSLDFGDMQASAQLCKLDDTGEFGVIRTGDLSPLFPDTDAKDIPFLLRLTHLLDQRESDWLVKADPKTAGSQLDRLPIGKDGAKVSSVLIALRRALTEQLRVATESLEKLEAELGEWMNLIQARDQAATKTHAALRSREEIADAILDIARQTQTLTPMPVSLIEPTVAQSGLEALHDALQQLVESRLTGIRKGIAGLAEVDGLISQFISEQARTQQVSKDFIAVTQELNLKREAQALAVAAVEQLQQALDTAEAERNGVIQQLNRLLNETQAGDLLAQRKQALVSLEKTMLDAESRASSLRAEDERNEQLRSQHKLIFNQHQTLLQIDKDLIAASQLLELWEQALLNLKSTEASIRDEEVQQDALYDQLSKAISSETLAADEALTARRHYETLNSAADSIRQAVASIAAHLPDDRGDCPLCGEEHGAVILHQRVSKSLEAIDPNVVDAERRVKNAADTLRERSEAATRADSDLGNCKSRISELQAQQASLLSEIEDLKSNALVDGDTVGHARESIRRREEDNNLAKARLDQTRQKLAPLPSRDITNQVHQDYESANRVLEVARQNRSQASALVDHAQAALAVITANSPPSQTLEDLSLAQNQKAYQIDALRADMVAARSALEGHQVQLADVTKRASDQETQLSNAQARLATVQTSWRHLSLPGDPSVETASTQEAQLKYSATEMTEHLQTIESLKIEISAWSKLEQTHLAQGLLDGRRGERSEAEYSDGLHALIRKEQTSQEQLTKLSKAMETLNQHLASEIEGVQRHVIAVVPRWQALLKRVVREHRFTATNLDFRSLRRRGHAEISVPLNGEAIPVPAIASEAQLTDLQLTFLLSMALDHQWSKWRGLLLDDPTQHHDLVHAASVFDVLRDYIVDHGFQVVIATHDALQARYFMRKLQNDGIEARILSLIPTPNGVIAEDG